MKLTIEATQEELRTKALGAVRRVASALAPHDPRLHLVTRALWKSETAQAGTVEFRGLRIVIENPVGSSRHWKDKASGREGVTVMRYPYGYIADTEGADGDEYDCFVGPSPDAPFVWVVHQARPDLGDTHHDAAAVYDEDKVMLGFDNVHDASLAYLQHFDDPKFFGSMSQMSIEEFIAKVKRTTAPGEDGMVKAKLKSSVPARPKHVRFVVPDPEFSKGGLEEMMTAANPGGMGNRAVVTGTSGLNIAMKVPPRPEHAHDITSPQSMRAAIEQVTKESKTGVAHAPKRDKAIFVCTTQTLDELPVHGLGEYEAARPDNRAFPGEIDQNRAYVEQKQKERFAFVQSANPERLFPREERFVIPKASTAPQMSVTVQKAQLGEVTLDVVPSGEFVVTCSGQTHEFNSLSAACDHVWVMQKGFASVDAWREATGRRKVPSGAGWKFWGLTPEKATEQLEAVA